MIQTSASAPMCANIKMIVRSAFRVLKWESGLWHRHSFLVAGVHARRDLTSNVEITANRFNSNCQSIRKFATQKSSKMVKAKKYVLVKHFVDEPKPSDLKLVEEELPPLQNGEYLVQAEYLSVDPYMRPYTQKSELGTTMIGSQVAKIVESRNPKYSIGQRIIGNLGWRTHTVINPNKEDDKDLLRKIFVLPDLGGLPPSLGLGMLGMPGNTAYFGLLEICKPKSGETIVISGAAGAVGSHVGQIAKIMGLTVIGICGSDEKCKWLTDELGFDSAINYKTMPVAASLRKAAPKGVDCYFDNVGGEISSTVIYQMNLFGRISVCGSISSYNANPSSQPQCTILQPAIVFNQLKMEGFIVHRWADRWLEGIQRNMQWIREGKLRYRETVTKGFENMFDAFLGMLQGQNFGKAIVQVSGNSQY